MTYVDLKRQFIPINKDEKFNPDVLQLLGYGTRSQLTWDDLLKKKRVVLLAEAASGKTDEFLNISRKLIANDELAFFLRIEELAEDGVSDSLDLKSAQSFEKWLHSTKKAYFFLDSLDEARLTGKRFESALRKLSKEFSKNLDQATLFVSCRVTDWKGEQDIQLIESYFPDKKNEVSEEKMESEDALLNPIFKKSQQSHIAERTKNSSRQSKITVVRLAPLRDEQKAMLAENLGIENTNEFLDDLWRTGLDTLSERPGDLIELARYWKSKGQFDNRLTMTEFSVGEKLSEADKSRQDNDLLSLKKSRQGAETLAAGLTFGKSFSLRTTDNGTDPNLSADTLKPDKLLPEWSDAQLGALLRRGIFAPGTYGRVRFHHRTTQEFLTAAWIHRLIREGCPTPTIEKLIFSETYGVKTIAPSLRPIVSWLCALDSKFIEEVIKRDPLVLLQSGDPLCLDIESKKRLLTEYAKKHEAGDIDNDTIEYRELWMFADPQLGSTINEIWKDCKKYDFRGDLLRLIEAGKINTCSNLCEEVAMDGSAIDQHRAWAIHALKSCESKSRLKNIARWFKVNPNGFSSRLRIEFARDLFPDYIGVDEVIDILRLIKPPKEDFLGNVSHILEVIWKNCPIELQWHYVVELTNLVFSEPYISNDERISERYQFLTNYFVPIAIDFLEKLKHGQPKYELVEFIFATNRSSSDYSNHDQISRLSKLIQGQAKVKQALFWRTVKETQAISGGIKEIVYFSQLYRPYHELWRWDESDIGWLLSDLSENTKIDEKRILLSTLIRIYSSLNKLSEGEKILNDLINENPKLEADLKEQLSPTKFDIETSRYQEQRNKWKKKEYIQAEKEKDSWKKYRETVLAKPEEIYSHAERFNHIHNLSSWLRKKTGCSFSRAVYFWEDLKTPFSPEIASLYNQSMKNHWRVTKPERPEWNNENHIETKHSALLASAAIGMEAFEDQSWSSNLSHREVELAAEHGVLTGSSYPDWLDKLLDEYPRLVAPIILKELTRQWVDREDEVAYLLSHFSNIHTKLSSPLATGFLEVILNQEPSNSRKLETGIRILHGILLTKDQKKRLFRTSIKKLFLYQSQQENEFAICWLSMLLISDFKKGFNYLEQWIKSQHFKKQQSLAENVFAVIFNRHESGLIGNVMVAAPVEVLKSLVKLAYRHINPNDDPVHEGTYTPSRRDNAQGGRDTILGALIKKKGANAYQAMIDLASSPEIGNSGYRFRQLARRMAERDSETETWIENHIVDFEKNYTSPIITADDLFKVVQCVLGTIKVDLTKADSSSLGVLSLLNNIEGADEEKVQAWLSEQLNLRSKAQYHIGRETEVAKNNRPDITISSTSNLFQVAIEVKQADSWTSNELVEALENQLVENYLQPSTRRHGILFLINHGKKKWKAKNTNKIIEFPQLVSNLNVIARGLNRNSSGKVAATVFGIDVT